VEQDLLSPVGTDVESPEAPVMTPNPSGGITTVVDAPTGDTGESVQLGVGPGAGTNVIAMYNNCDWAGSPLVGEVTEGWLIKDATGPSGQMMMSPKVLMMNTYHH
jgi:hypothetical protein